jgi:hypothetical protein
MGSDRPDHRPRGIAMGAQISLRRHQAGVEQLHRLRRTVDLLQPVLVGQKDVRREQQGRVDAPGRDRPEGRRAVACAQHGHVLVGRQAVGLQVVASDPPAQRAGTRGADRVTLEVGQARQRRPRPDLAGRGGRRRRDHHHVHTLQQRTDPARAKDEVALARDQRRVDLPAGEVGHLGLQMLLGQEPGVLGREHGQDGVRARRNTGGDLGRCGNRWLRRRGRGRRPARAQQQRACHKHDRDSSRHAAPDVLLARTVSRLRT